jgi:group I intron endonuclease
MGVIYKLTSPSGKVYIGKASVFKKRMSSHCAHAKRGSPGPLYNAIRKYGWENFQKEIIEETLDLDNRECFWIAHYDSTNSAVGYNITEGGTGGNVWVNFSEDHKEYLRKKMSGRPYNEATKEKQRETIKATIAANGHWSKGQDPWNKGKRTQQVPWNKGLTGLKGRKVSEEEKVKTSERFSKPKSEEHKEKLRKANLGKTLSEETKRKISQANMGRKEKEYTCPYCGKTGKSGAMIRWHFENCKKKGVGL